MDESENLPVVIAAQAVAVKSEKHGSLVARGMAALANKNDALYRQAREVYNLLTDDGLIHWFGYKDREPPLTEAFNIFLQLAREGYGKAYFPLSTLYTGEQSVKGDTAQAERFHKLAFDWLLANEHLESPEIWHDLGVVYGFDEEIESAIKWFRKAADAGHNSSMWALTGLYEDGEDIANALYWQIKAAEAGHEGAQRGLKVQHDRGGLDVDDEQVFNWYVWSAEHGHVWAQLFLAEAFRHGADVDQDYEQAVYWYRLAAEQGNAEGQWRLGSMYEEFFGVEHNDDLAVYWYQMAAEQGDVEAQWLLGGMYEYGRGVIPDIGQAESWYRKAAEQGEERAQKSLDEMFDEGHGAVQDEEQSTYWNIKSAEKGHSWAMRNLGLMYHNGLRVEQDYAQAAYWFGEAARLGDVESKSHLREIRLRELKTRLAKLSPEAQKRVLKAVKASRDVQKHLRPQYLDSEEGPE